MDLDIEEVIREQGEYLYRYAMVLAAMPSDAEELVQLTFIKAWEKREQLQTWEAMRGWLRKILLNEFRMMMRKRNSMREEEFSNLDQLEEEGKLVKEPEDVSLTVTIEKEIEKMRSGCFLAMSRKLTLPQRMAFALHDMYGLSMKETALLMEVKEGAVKGLLYRARMNLDAFFSDHCPYIKEENACRCRPWQEFVKNREQLQQRMNLVFDEREFERKGYTYQENVRQRVRAIYEQLPAWIPENEWYDKTIEAVQSVIG